MLRGFLGGAASALALSALALAASSLVAPQPAGNAPPAVMPLTDAPMVAVPPGLDNADGPDLPAADTGVTANPGPVAAVVADRPPEVALAGTDPGVRPVVDPASVTIAAPPEPGSSTAAVALSGPDPAPGPPDAGDAPPAPPAPPVPLNDTDPTAWTETALPRTETAGSPVLIGTTEDIAPDTGGALTALASDIAPLGQSAPSPFVGDPAEDSDFAAIETESLPAPLVEPDGSLDAAVLLRDGPVVVDGAGPQGADDTPGAGDATLDTARGAVPLDDPEGSAPDGLPATDRDTIVATTEVAGLVQPLAGPLPAAPEAGQTDAVLVAPRPPVGPQDSPSATGADPGPTADPSLPGPSLLVEAPDLGPAPAGGALDAAIGADPLPAPSAGAASSDAPQAGIVAGIAEAPLAEAAVEPAEALPAAAEDLPQAGLVMLGESGAMPQGTGAVRILGREEPATDLDGGAGEEVILIDVPPPDGPPLVRYASPFVPVEGVPPLAIVLFDEGDVPGASAAVAALGFPVSVAIDPARPGAVDRMAAYRSQGIEVLVAPDIPPGSRPTDVAVALEAAFADLPETVGLFDGGAAGLSDDAERADLVIRRLAADGRGLVALAEGLSRLDAQANAAGVPAALVFDDLDGDGQDERVIRRFLDNAAFRAGQGGNGLVLMARVRPETLAALASWRSSDRAGRVVLAPVSAVMGMAQN
jgi:polysaccharide deacetylase 2 family uncharacterized protein YibQ